MTKTVLFLLAASGLAIAAMPAMAQRSAATGYTEERLSQLQQTLSDLSHRLDDLRRQNQQLEQKLEKLQASYEQRLERLEKGVAAKPPPPRKSPAKP